MLLPPPNCQSNPKRTENVLQIVKNQSTKGEGGSHSTPEDEVLQHTELASVDALIAAGTTGGKKHRMNYSFMKKQEVLQATVGMSERAADRAQAFPHWTISDWRKNKEDIFAFVGSEKTLSRAPGRPESVPVGIELITYMKDTRQDWFLLTARSMAVFVRESYPEWLQMYVGDKKNACTAYESLLRLLRRFAYRHDSGLKVPLNCNICSKVYDPEAIQLAFAVKFNKSFGSYPASAIYNTDETGIYYDTPPSNILSPKGHVYIVQKKARMDSRVWAFYLRSRLHYHIAELSVLLLNNLKCHVSAASEEIVACASVCGAAIAQKLHLETEKAMGAREKRVVTIKRTIQAWESINTSTVTKAFNKALNTEFWLQNKLAPLH
ncbi:hypothetical protein JG688_00017429 [Phytophthora aleatoria]|uniref:DDE-1 domain-containing protein n=1 Tax=Phytophthora aleatoria TaxID=2496075 RepID=A0A8J5ISL5_9STRA|nr:hypothetical protein JG688_00017429 [Phytophthora aleatoria]